MSAWLKYWLTLGLLLWVVGCGGSSQQSVQDVANSQVAVSKEGTAIAGDNNNVQINNNQIPMPPEMQEWYKEFQERQSKELNTFQSWQIGIGLGVLFLLISIGMLWVFWGYIISSSSRTHLIRYLQKGVRRHFYKLGVSRVLSFLLKIYDKKHSYRALTMSIYLAFFYPFLFFLYAYTYTNGANNYLGIDIFSDSEHYKLPTALLIIISLIIAYIILTTINKMYRSILTILILIYSKLINTNIINLLRLSRVTFATCSVIILTYQLKLDIAIPIIIALSFFNFMIYSYNPFIATQKNRIDIIFITFLIIISFVSFYDKESNFYSENNISALLPVISTAMIALINGAIDYLSWWVSRAFLEKTLQTDKVWLITLEVLIDAFLAILFMLALCLLLPAGAIALDTLFSHWVDADGQSATTNWQYYAYAAAVAPFGEGLMVTLMLWTTLLPTFIHLVLGCLAIIIFSLKGQALATFLINTPEGDRLRYTAASLWLYGYLLLSIGIVSALIWLILKLADLPIAAWLYEFTRYFYAAYGLPVV